MEKISTKDLNLIFSFRIYLVLRSLLDPRRSISARPRGVPHDGRVRAALSPGVLADLIQSQGHQADFLTRTESSWVSSAGSSARGRRPRAPAQTSLSSPAPCARPSVHPPCRRCQSPGAGYGSPASRPRPPTPNRLAACALPPLTPTASRLRAADTSNPTGRDGQVGSDDLHQFGFYLESLFDRFKSFSAR